MSTITHITRIGNSKGIILPSEVIKALALEEGDEVELAYDTENQILSAKFPRTKQLKLVDLHKS
jgi:antitoxin component of MazEF toxin-antitoxin module